MSSPDPSCHLQGHLLQSWTPLVSLPELPGAGLQSALQPWPFLSSPASGAAIIMHPNNKHKNALMY